MTSAAEFSPHIVPLVNHQLPDDCFVFKHSTQCPISAAAAAEVKAAPWNEAVYWINVIEQRQLSNWVEERYATRHESPQLLKIRSGKVVAVWNHGEVRREKFLESNG